MLKRRCNWVCILIVFSFRSSWADTSGVLSANDDGSSAIIPLEFTNLDGSPAKFTFFGQQYDSVYVNNNGNITFGGPLAQYTPDAFPASTGLPMIAPFWADVDTRNGKGSVTYESNETHFKAMWQDVGYYDATQNENTDARNTFSLTIQRNNGILFEYGSMNWTTGEASGGHGGFGGTPATLGIDAGDGQHYRVIDRFVDPRVSYLDGTRWYFQTDNSDLGSRSFKQFSSPWGSTTTLNSTRYTMSNSGCFVTAAAMVLTSLGHNTDPGKLNQLLRQTNSGGDLSFPNLPERLSYGQVDGINGPPVRFRNGGFIVIPSQGPLGSDGDTELRTQITSQLKSVVDQYGPIILRVPSRNWGSHHYLSSHTHAIVVDHVSDDGVVSILDPGWSNSPVTLNEWAAFVNNHVTSRHPDWRLTNADGTGDGRDLSWLAGSHFTYAERLDPFSRIIIQGQANSPIEFVVSDSLGRRLGRNPETGESFNEIPGSSYFREFAAAPADDNVLQLDDPGYGHLSFEIGEIVPGNYHFQVYGLDTGPWSIQFHTSNPIRDFDARQFFFDGQAAAGSRSEFDSVVVPEPSLYFSALIVIGLLRKVRRHAASFGERITD